MIRCSETKGVYALSAPEEYAITCGTWKTNLSTQPYGVIFCHGANDTYYQPHRDQSLLIHGLARYASVITADLGGPITFSNDAVLARIADARTYLMNNGVTGKIALIGMSMGAGNALAYTLRYPEQIACVAGVIPCVDYDDLALVAGTSQALQDAYAPNGYSSTVDGPTRDPIKFAASIDSSLPVHLFYSPNDSFTRAQTIVNFKALRPSTMITQIPGNLDHTDAAVTAITPSVMNFVLDSMSIVRYKV